MTGERMAKKQLIEPWIGMWMSTVVLFPLSIWITVKAMRESAITRRADGPRRIVRFFRLFTKRKSQLGS